MAEAQRSRRSMDHRTRQHPTRVDYKDYTNSWSNDSAALDRYRGAVELYYPDIEAMDIRFQYGAPDVMSQLPEEAVSLQLKKCFPTGMLKKETISVFFLNSKAIFTNTI